MTERFVHITALIEQFYKCIIKIKTLHMKELGLKASHVMCLFYIGKTPQGLTASELCSLCLEDKAAISKVLAELKSEGLVYADNDNGTKVYRIKYRATERGTDVCKFVNARIEDAVNACQINFTEEESQFFYGALESIVTKVKEYYGSLNSAYNTKGEKT